MLPLGTAAPSFDLPAANPLTAGSDRNTLGMFADAKALVIAFTCNHCPYAVAVEPGLIALANAWQPKGVAFVAINSNDAVAYPADDFASMSRRAEEQSFPFPYLFDESQEVARAFGAACTPDFYFFDGERRLAYRGRIHDGRPGKDATTSDLSDAIELLLDGGSIPADQVPSMGCNIKWRVPA